MKPLRFTPRSTARRTIRANNRGAKRSLSALILAMAAATSAHASDARTEISLTPAEIAEREARKGCKIKICSVFRLREPGDDVTCNVEKSWRKSQLDKMVGRAGVSWPWGPVKCKADINLPREQMIKAMVEPDFKLSLSTHTVACTIEREKEPAKVSFSFKPDVTFKEGKAVKAALNWGKIEAPTLVKGAMWTATATDNTFNVLQSMVVEDINRFLGESCDEVKGELK
jgi:hypothetical protein